MVQNRKLGGVIVCLCAALGTVSVQACSSGGSGYAYPPLTPQQQAVYMASGDQAVTLDLNSRCAPTGALQTVTDEYEARVRAVEVGANVAQVLYSRTYNDALTSIDVRFWSCP